MDKILIIELIIEDDPDIAAIERDYLELSGCAVTICANGTDGQRAALEGAFDRILLDLMLPGTDGFSICRAVRSCCRRSGAWDTGCERTMNRPEPFCI